MFANKTVLRNALASVNRIYGARAGPILSLQIQNGSRNLHCLHHRTESFRRPLEKIIKLQLNNNRVAGYIIFSRNESSTTTIPPLTSEVFSKQVEQHLTSSAGSATGSFSNSVQAQSPSTPPALSADNSQQSINSSSNIATEASPIVTSSSSATESLPVEAISTATSSESLEWIPEAPIVPNAVEELALNALGEPTFASLGLGSWWPPGIVQQLLEMAHVNIGLPWWGAILLGTVCVRLMVFPLVVKSQRNAAKMTNNSPQMQAIQLKMTEARQTGNALMAAKYGQDLMLFMKEKDISPFKSILVPLAMAPIFISFFIGLRKMANLPVESMKEGGLFWFTDLTLADPYCILPLMTSVTLWITMEVGVDGVQLNASQHGQVMRYVMRAIPIIMFPLTMNFPAAILCYWVSTNAISLAQVSIMKLPAVRKTLGIEQLRRVNISALPAVPKKGFVASFKDSWTNLKISKEMEERTRYDEIAFKRAGRGPIPKTYKYDPTKVSPSMQQPNAMQAKQKR